MQIIIRRTLVRHKRILKALTIGILVSGISFQVTETPSIPQFYATSPVADSSLSNEDAVLYRAVFQAQQQGEWDKADTVLPQLQDQRLLGTVLAMRYLDERYKAAEDELVVWLQNYNDHPEASRILKLAERKGASEDDLATITENRSVQGIGRVDTMGNADMPANWYRGISLWKGNDIAGALAQFQKAGEAERLTSWQRAAIAFWQYRAYDKLERADEAEAALAEAATYPRTYYGMLAGEVRGDRLALTALSPYVPTTIRNHPAVLRAAALSQIAEYKRAEQELRNLYNHLPETDRSALITLASQLNLPNLQVRLGQAKGLSEEETIFASYPMPGWLSDTELAVDSALMFAISRQESSFATEVKSHAGATGLMQLMPSTANYIWQKSSGSLMASLDASTLPADNARLAQSDLHDPRTNMLLGQEYIRYLIGKPGSTANLIQVIAGYNAGPGMVSVWNRSASHINDPLLYVESIPYKETRHYVMQVLSNYWAYQSLMGKDTASLHQLAAGKWPTIYNPER